MSADHLQAPDAPGFKLDPRVAAAFGRFSGGYWRGPGARGAWALTLGLAALLVLSIGAAVALNLWTAGSSMPWSSAASRPWCRRSICYL